MIQNSKHLLRVVTAGLASTLVAFGTYANAQGAAPAQERAGAASTASSAATGTGAVLTVRPEIGVFLQDAQRLLAEKKNQEAADKIQAAEAVAAKTPYELHVLARVKAAFAVASGDADLAAQQFEQAGNGPWLTATERVASFQAVAALYYNAKNYTNALTWVERYFQGGGNDPSMFTLRAQSLYLKGDYANAANALAAEIGKATSAGQKPAEIQLRLLADSRGRVHDEAGHTRALEMLVHYYPDTARWQSLLARLWSKPGLAPSVQLDVFRLQRSVSGLTEPSDYTDMAEMALQAGSAIEANDIIEQGYAAGVIGAGPKAAETGRLRAKVAKAAAEDRATLEKDIVRAKGLPDGLAMLNYGFNLVQIGQTERGIAQMEQGLTRGIARNSESAKLRLVAAYAKIKEVDKAKQLLSSLADKTDPVGLTDIVRYWGLFLGQR